MKNRVLGLFIVAILLTGLLSVFFFMRREKELALQWLTENSRSQLDLMGDLLESDLEKMKSQIARIAALMEAGQSDEAQKNLNGFLGVAAIDTENSAFLWKIQINSDGSTSAKDEWSAQWIQKLREANSNESDIRFFANQSPEGDIRSAISLMANVRDRKSGQATKVRLIGILPKALFQELIDKLKVQGVHLFLTTSSGLTLAHSVSEYVGNAMVGDRTYEEIRKQKSSFGSITSKDVRGEDILSFFVKLPVGRLTLVSQWRKELWVTSDWSFYGQWFFIVLAIAVLGGALVQFQLARMKKDFDYEKNSERIKRSPLLPSEELTFENKKSIDDNRIIENQSHLANKNDSSKLIKLEAESEKTEIPQSLKVPARPPSLFQTPLAGIDNRDPLIPLKVVDKIIARLRAPLLSVLGHVQIARLNPQGGSLQAIESEVRSARDVLDRVGQYAGQAQIPSVTLCFLDVVDSSLRSLEGAILRCGVKIIREIPAEFSIKCDYDEMKLALSALFRNSIEAMEKNLRKTLILRASKQNAMIVFEIEDSGEGILPENLDRIFDPFFTTRLPVDHQGLGLAMASGILRQHGAQVHVKSKIGEGTLMTVKFPMSHEVVQNLNERSQVNRKFREVETPSLEALESAATFQFNEITTEKMTSITSETNFNFQTSLDSVKVPIKTDLKTEPFSTEKSQIVNTPSAIIDTFNLFDDEDEDSFGEFQFGKLDFVDSTVNNLTPKNSSKNYKEGLSLGEKAAQEVLRSLEMNLGELGANSEVNSSSGTSSAQLSSSPVKRLKKKDEPLAKIKVQIPRPEERL